MSSTVEAFNTQPFAAVAPEEKDRLNCTMAVLLLSDAGQEITSEAILNVIASAGGRVHNSAWVTMFAHSIQFLDVQKITQSLFAGNSGATASAPQPRHAAAQTPAAAVVDQPVEAPVEDIDMGEI